MSERTNTAKWMEAQRRWQINVQKDGMRRSFYSSTPGRTGQREANRKADAWLKRIDGPQARRKRWSEALDEYREYCVTLAQEKRNAGKIVGHTMKSRELGNYRQPISNLECWGAPLAHRYMDTLRDGDIQAVLDLAAARGRSKKTIKNIKTAFDGFFKFCRRRGYTIYRPEEVEIPQQARLKERHILQPEHLEILFGSDQTLWRGKPAFEKQIYAFRFAVLTGLRPGELMALQVEDWDGDTLHVRGSINDSGELTAGKNQNAIRDIHLYPLAREQLARQCLLTGRRSGYMFDIPSQHAQRQRWYTYCEHNGLPHITPYEMRHTFVSIAQKLPEGMLKPIVGHSKNMDTFGVYGHTVNGYQEDAAARLESIFEELLAPGE